MRCPSRCQLPCLFSMTDIPKDLLLQQGRLVLALILSHAGLFLVAWFSLGFVKPLHGTPSIIYALMLSTSATPVFGLAVLKPILGPTSAGTVGLVALAINLTVPPAVILLEMDAAAKHQQGATDSSKPSDILTGLNAGLKSPLLWAPILGIAVVLASIHLPTVVASCLELIGSATSGERSLLLVSYWRLIRSAFRQGSSRVHLLESPSNPRCCSRYYISYTSLALSRVSHWCVAAFLWLPWSCSLQHDIRRPNRRRRPCF